MRICNLRTARQAVGLSQRELGRKCRLSQGMISAFETGRLIPGPELLRRLSESLGVPANVIIPADDEVGKD